jgi:hypothetical protein
VFDFFVLAGDANRDRGVTLADFNILAGNFGLSPRRFSEGDFNYTTLVDLADFNIVAGQFGTFLGAPALPRNPGSDGALQQPRSIFADALIDAGRAPDDHDWTAELLS